MGALLGLGDQGVPRPFRLGARRVGRRLSEPGGGRCSNSDPAPAPRPRQGRSSDELNADKGIPSISARVMRVDGLWTPRYFAEIVWYGLGLALAVPVE